MRGPTPSATGESKVSLRLAGEGSNLQHTDSKSVVLPIELPATARLKTLQDSFFHIYLMQRHQ